MLLGTGGSRCLCSVARQQFAQHRKNTAVVLSLDLGTWRDRRRLGESRSSVWMSKCCFGSVGVEGERNVNGAEWRSCRNSTRCPRGSPLSRKLCCPPTAIHHTLSWPFMVSQRDGTSVRKKRSEKKKQKKKIEEEDKKKVLRLYEGGGGGGGCLLP